ncbi:Exostosin domain-containing protein [Psidium guajava]|nr:Exostosin domain-containing protein [Psidium guajava]
MEGRWLDHEVTCWGLSFAEWPKGQPNILMGKKHSQRGVRIPAILEDKHHGGGGDDATYSSWSSGLPGAFYLYSRVHRNVH